MNRTTFSVAALLIRCAAAFAFVSAPLAAQAAEPVESPPALVIIQAPKAPEFGWRMPAMPFDNLRLGLAQLQNNSISRLFGGNGGLAFGLDVPLASGVAIALDTMNLQRSYPTTHYWLSVNPVQLRYRLGLFEDAGAAVQPFATVGAGLTAMGLFGQGDTPRLGVGPAFSTGVGATLWDRFALEAGVQAGQAAQIPYWGLTLRAGTGFGSLDRLARWWPQPQPAERLPLPKAPERPVLSAGALTGKVLEVAGNRLTIGYAEAPDRGVGDELVIYYHDGMEVKVARARVVELQPNGRAIAQVLVSTEPIRPGYMARGW